MGTALFSTQANFLQVVDNPSTTFKKRKGTTDKGKDYEHLYMAHLILKLTVDDTIRDFQLSSNDDDFGAFDDVIVEIEHTNGDNKTHAIQLKHIDGLKTLAKDALSTSSKKANFSILKYFQEAQHVKTSAVPINFIILTNNRFGVSDNEEITLGDESRVVIRKSDKDALINTCDTGNCYRFRSKIPGSKFDDFFDNFELYTDQVNVDKIKMNTLNEFTKLFACGEDIFEKYAKFINEWSIPDGQKPKLDKMMMKQVIAMFVLSPYTKSLVFEDEAVVEEAKLLQEAVSKFHVTVCDKNYESTVCKMWKDCKSRLPQDMGVLKRGAKKYQIMRPGVYHFRDLNDEECTKLLWLMGVGPLVVTDSECVRRAIKLCRNTIVLLVDESHDYDDGFCKLSDLAVFPEIFDNVVRKFRFSMQGKEKISLEKLIQVDRRIVDVVTTNELLQMSEGRFVIGGKGETLPPCHIERRLSRNIVDYQTILRIENSALFISSLNDNNKFDSHNVVKVDETFFGRNYRHTKGTIYVVEDDSSWLLFDTFCHTIGTSADNCQHFRYLPDGNFEWIASRSGFGDLKQHLQEDHHVEEKSLQRYEFYRNLNIVCADPGMGKTTLMQSLKNQISSDLWTVLIYARNHSRHFRQHEDDIEEFHKHVLDQVKKKLSAFDVKIFEIMVEQNLVRYIWDGLDEVSTKNAEAVLGVIGKLHNSGLQQWITSRNNMKERLERLYRVPSTTLRQFDENEQRCYIRERLNCTEQEMVTIFEKIKKNVQLFPYNDILGIPLQIYIITELFRKNMQKYLVILDEVFSIADLYDHFVDEKFQVYNIDKEKANDNNDLVYERIQNEKTERVYQYEKAALTVHLPQELVIEWGIKCKKFLTELQSGKDRFGIIIDVDEENLVEFVHNSFGEYFTALYFSKHLNRVPETRKFLFDDRYSNIRFFFDLMLAMNKAHIAVLYRNTDLLEKCNEEELLSKDKGGRNALQLISSWGLRCPDLNIDTNNDGYIIDNRNMDMSAFRKGESSDHCTIFEKLTKLCPSGETDDLFQMTSFSYAFKSSSLLSLAMLTFRSLSVSDDFKQKSTLIFFYCTVADYTRIFDIMEVPYVKTSDNPIEFLLTKTQSVKSLRKIVNIDHYKKNLSQRSSDWLLLEACRGGNPEIVQLFIDNGSNLDARAITEVEGMLPIVTVANNGYYDAAKVLIDNGVDVNVKNKDGFSAIHAACQFQHYDIVKLLIDSKAHIDQPDKQMGTPLHYCLSKGNYEIAKLLCENGVDVNQRPPHLKALEPKLRFNMIQKKYPKLAHLLLQYGFDLTPSLEEKVSALKQRIRMMRYILGKLERGEVGV